MVICAWCDLTMRPGTLPASHGICDTCRQALEDDADEILNRVESTETYAS